MLKLKTKICSLPESKKSGLPMKTRLFFFLAALVLVIISGVVIVLFINGTLSASLAYNRNIVAKDLRYAADSIAADYGRLSVQAITYARELAGSIEQHVTKLGFAVEHIRNHPALLEEIISAEYDRTNFFLQTSKCSGAFFILDATVNPSLPNAEKSRAGLYLKNMEPNIVSASAPNLIVFRGFPGIARSNMLSLHSLWELEFNISDAPYYRETITAAKTNPSLPLSRLYNWSTSALPGAGEKVMLCTVPLLAENGHVFGLAGLEVSEMLFKLSYAPSNSVYKRLFCTLSPFADNRMDLTQSMIAGGYSAGSIARKYNNVVVGKNKHALTVYQHESNPSFLGMHEFIDLYPQDSFFAARQWAVAVMAPQADIVSSITRTNFKLYILLLLLLIFGIGASLFLSKKYLEPIDKGLTMIKSAGLSAMQRTRVPELDDLIAFLDSHQNAIYQRAAQENLSLQVLDEFLENTKTLSPAERRVFKLFVRGYKVAEIAAILNLSVNTIKTHNKHIFQKLDIASREELILYVRMLKEIGKDIEN